MFFFSFLSVTLLTATPSFSAPTCPAALSNFFQLQADHSYHVYVDGRSMSVKGEKSLIEPINTYSEGLQFVIKNVFVELKSEERKVFIPKYYISGSGLSELCRRLTGGRYPYHHSDYNMKVGQGFIAKFNTMTFESYRGQSILSVNVKSDRFHGRAYITDLICAETPSTY